MCSSKIGAPTPVGKVRPVLTVVPGTDDAEDPRRPEGAASLIDTIVRDGARRMLAAASGEINYRSQPARRGYSCRTWS
jgi:hypothetical protein